MQGVRADNTRPASEGGEIMTILSSGDGRTVCPPAVSRRDNPQTSFEAEEAINKAGARVTHLSVVLGVIESQPGLTTGEVGDASGLGQMETRKRISDLKNMGMIFAGDVRVWEASGRNQSTWWPISKDGVQEALL